MTLTFGCLLFGLENPPNRLFWQPKKPMFCRKLIEMIKYSLSLIYCLRYDNFNVLKNYVF